MGKKVMGKMIKELDDLLKDQQQSMNVFDSIFGEPEKDEERKQVEAMREND